jgi:KamA family protein
MKTQDADRTVSGIYPQKYQSYSVHNFRDIPQIAKLTDQQKTDIEVVGHVLPLKVNKFVVDHLIDWRMAPNDPMFTLVFNRREMLHPHHYEQIAALLRAGADQATIGAAAGKIRAQLNPHPAGQVEHNVPTHCDRRLAGVKHKYDQTVLFFPIQGQTCHAYCSFCFRWPQFAGPSFFRFASREIELLISYVRQHPRIADVLFTGGDPLIMSTNNLRRYVQPLIDAQIPHLRRIRIGTKAFSYWPQRFVSDADANDLLSLFRSIVASGKHLAVMAHFNHPRELKPTIVRDAIQRVRKTGAEIRTQSPLLGHINDDADLWVELWDEQVDLGCIPYYMFVARDTGAQHYFGVPLVRAWKIYRTACKQVSGLCRTVRGPSMSTDAGKVQVLAVTTVMGQRVIELAFLQARNPDWVHRPFFAEYDEKAIWLSELKPAFGEEKFFFEEDLESLRFGKFDGDVG